MSAVIVTAQMPADLVAAMRSRAQSADRSLSAEMRCAIRSYLENGNAPAANQGAAKADPSGRHGTA